MLTSKCKVLVANRGEIAVRVLRSATELGWATLAIYTDKDESHTTFAEESVKLDSAADYLDVSKIVEIAQRFQCTHVHPGYGFLSESPILASALPASIIFIGPSVETLRIAFDKLLSRALASSLAINVAPGRTVSSVDDIRDFARTNGLPIMIKAVDGGGGRGIRIVRGMDDVDQALQRCLGESPSRRIFVEQSLTGPGWKHIEVQIVGDGTGAVIHLWERDCSVQRRFQKIVEMAPSRLPLSLIRVLLDASISMAKQLKYLGLGTFEYLVNAQTLNWVFLEINPRVQVEHTITEEIVGIDLVRTQLLLFSSSPTLQSLNISEPQKRPSTHAVQLRLTAEDPARSFQPSTGVLKHGSIVWPSGPGIRTDTWLTEGPFTRNGHREWTIVPDFDSLLAKIIVRAKDFKDVAQRAAQALRELHIDGGSLRTNCDLLAGIVQHPDWISDNVDTLWLERNLSLVIGIRNRHASGFRSQRGPSVPNSTTPIISHGSSRPNPLLHPGTLFHLTLSPVGEPALSTIRHTVTLSSIAENDFPTRLSGIMQTSDSPTPFEFSLTQSQSAAVSGSSFELANPNDRNHVASPMTGKVVELHRALLAAEGSSVATTRADRFIRKGETLLTLSVMKMESAVIAQYDGYVERVAKGISRGVIVGEGALVCILQDAALPTASKL